MKNSSLQGAVFDAIVGAVFAAAMGAVCWWLVGGQDSLPIWLAAFTALGLILGIAIGIRQRALKRDVATPICIICAIPPALLIIAASLGEVRGKVTLYVAGGIAIAFPMLGLIVGGLLDRLRESVSRQNNSDA
jgi:hypothetical protein